MGLTLMDVSTAPYALVVDDDPLILMDARDILEEAGFRCHDRDTGAEAIELLETHAEGVVLVFSDVEMPGDVDGFALARHVCEHWPWIEIVIASGRIKPQPGDMPDKPTFIGKPFNQRFVHDHLSEKLPEEKKPEPLKHAV
ncbi:response regulator [Sphingomonas sp. PAMC 26621]|uniref:response regulator n=1 Tax=Sphingomonas sp. PAMC 26621 TaxID=1112213 RepID=UPI0002888287|nr:response regulator [Sphingomonas sp. PAMC 26621]